MKAEESVEGIENKYFFTDRYSEFLIKYFLLLVFTATT